MQTPYRILNLERVSMLPFVFIVHTRAQETQAEKRSTRKEDSNPTLWCPIALVLLTLKYSVNFRFCKSV
jgi:hypothetical protein